MAELPTPSPPHPRRGVVAVIPREQRLLVIRRSHLVRAPRRYCFPGGGTDEGETEPDALIRELQEELNVVIVPQRRLWTSMTPWSVSLSWWLAELPGDVEPVANPLEVETILWLEPHEIRALPELLESNRQFLDALERGEFRW